VPSLKAIALPVSEILTVTGAAKTFNKGHVIWTTQLLTSLNWPTLKTDKLT